MTIKTLLLLAFMIGFKFLYSSFVKSDETTEGPINEMWWNELSDEWKTIFIINQNFQKQNVGIFLSSHTRVVLLAEQLTCAVGEEHQQRRN